VKLPFDFATKFLLRLLLPGALLTAISWPVLLGLRHRLGLAVDDKAVLPVAILAWGWTLLLLDMPIYMAFEGRRFWPAPLRRFGAWWQARRLARLIARRAALGDDPVGTEVALKIRRYPLSKAGDPVALYPTRIGNLIAASEKYPDRKYGIDGVFGWYRLWVTIDKDLRGELDDQQAIVDGALYAAFATLIGAGACLLYALLHHMRPWVLPMLPSARALLGLGAASLVASNLFYRATLSAQAGYGELFCALFDQNIDAFDFDTVIAQLSDTLNDPTMLLLSPREEARAAIRFLRWHRYKPPGGGDNVVVRDW
jgi:hypothetical protein